LVAQGSILKKKNCTLERRKIKEKKSERKKKDKEGKKY